MHTQQPYRNPEKNNHGYSIIEAMIALGILSIGLLAIISMQVSSTANIRKSGDSTEAISRGTAELERLMALSYTDLNTPSVIAPGFRLNQGSGGRFDIFWSVSDPALATPAPNTVTITVNVSWDPQTGGGTQTMTLTSVKADMNL
ncbi:MAG: prepilin-type N-terminal cleavage/methylation domain-containing protein [Pseudomonadota bacterium]